MLTEIAQLYFVYHIRRQSSENILDHRIWQNFSKHPVEEGLKLIKFTRKGLQICYAIDNKYSEDRDEAIGAQRDLDIFTEKRKKIIFTDNSLRENLIVTT